MVRDVDADVELLLTYFDPTTADELRERIGNCRITSLAEIVAPVLAGLVPGRGPRRGPDGRRPPARPEHRRRGASRGARVDVPHPRRGRALASALLKPYDRSAALLLYGAVGIVAILLLETITAVGRARAEHRRLLLRRGQDARHRRPERQGRRRPDGVQGRGLGHDARRARLRGVLHRRHRQPADRPAADRPVRPPTPSRARTTSSSSASARSGCGCAELLRECGVAVVASTTRRRARTSAPRARPSLPVVIGRGADPSLLRRLSLQNAQAVAAVTNDDLENLSIAMTVLSLRARPARRRARRRRAPRQRDALAVQARPHPRRAPHRRRR